MQITETRVNYGFVVLNNRGLVAGRFDGYRTREAARMDATLYRSAKLHAGRMLVGQFTAANRVIDTENV